MTCMVPSNELFGPSENKYFVNNWGRRHYIEESSSDEEAHPVQFTEKQTLDRLQELHDLSMRISAESPYRFPPSDEQMPPTNRKRIFYDNSSPDFRVPHSPEHYSSPHSDEGYRKLTLSQFATSASEQEPLYPDDEDVEEILMRLRHGHDYYRPKVSTPPPTLPSILFTPPPNMPRHFFPQEPNFLPSHVPSPSPNKASLFHILSQEPENVNSMSAPHHHHHMSVHNNLHMRKMFFDESIIESSDEMGLEHPKKKARRENKPKSPLKSIIVNNDDVQEKETVAAGLCFKTHKPKVQREYYYAKLSKTIFRWTCCGSQAKTHPDA